MPIPLVFAAVAAGVGAAGTYLTVREVRKPMAVMVVGQGLTGKTTLIKYWQGEWVSDPLRTPVPEKIATIKINTGRKFVFVEKKFLFKKMVDISGQDEQMANFRSNIQAATVVVYLINAMHLLAEENRPAHFPHDDEWVRLMYDASRLNRHCGRARRIVLAVTHTDLDPRLGYLGESTYHARISGQLATMREKIGDSDRVRIVAGSLASATSALAFSEQIISSLL